MRANRGTVVFCLKWKRSSSTASDLLLCRVQSVSDSVLTSVVALPEAPAGVAGMAGEEVALTGWRAFFSTFTIAGRRNVSAGIGGHTECVVMSLCVVCRLFW